MKTATGRAKLEKFINNKYTDITIAALILLSILLLILETIWEKGDFKIQYNFCVIANDFITVLFVIELLIRYLTFIRKRRFFKSYWLDILAVLPVMRAFRILRVLRLLRIFRMGVLLSRRFFSVSALFREGVKEYLIVFLIIIMVVLTGAMAIRILEGDTNAAFKSFDEALWWSTLSMISGEPINHTPVTFWGKLITLIIMLGGLTVFAVFTGVVSAVMVQKLRGGMDVKELEIEALNKHVIVCGWNRSVRMIVEEFQSDKESRDTPIVLISEFLEDPTKNYDFIDRTMIYVLKGDYTKVDVLKRAGVEKARIAFILPDKSIQRSDQDRDARSVLAALIIEKMNKDIFTCVELLNRDNETHLQMAGVEEVIVSDEYSGNIMAAAAKNFGIVSVLNELFTSKYGNQFYKIEVPPSWIRKFSMDMFVWLKENYNAILLSVENDRNGTMADTRSKVNPDKNYCFKKGDYIIVISHQKITLE
ncbi:MAG: potassium channel protein [bacterium]|nr:potassium channel protein [bacterium]